MSWLNTIMGSFMALTFGALAYFAKRLIDENDRQHRETGKILKETSREVRSIGETVKTLQGAYESLAKGGGSGGANYPSGEVEKIKRKVSSAIVGIHQIQKDIDKILPQVENNQERYGEIIWVKDEVSKQNKKLEVMFRAMTKIVEKNQKH